MSPLFSLGTHSSGASALGKRNRIAGPSGTTKVGGSVKTGTAIAGPTGAGFEAGNRCAAVTSRGIAAPVRAA